MGPAPRTSTCPSCHTACAAHGMDGDRQRLDERPRFQSEPRRQFQQGRFREGEKLLSDSRGLKPHHLQMSRRCDNAPHGKARTRHRRFAEEPWPNRPGGRIERSGQLPQPPRRIRGPEQPDRKCTDACRDKRECPIRRSQSGGCAAERRGRRSAGFGTSENSIFPGLVMVARSISTLPGPQNFAWALARRGQEQRIEAGIGAVANAHHQHFDGNLQAGLPVM